MSCTFQSGTHPYIKATRSPINVTHKNMLYILSHFSHVQLYATSWTVQPTRLLCPWDFSRQEYWSGLPFPSPGNLPNPGTESRSLASAALAGGLFTTSAWKAPTRRHHRLLTSFISISKFIPAFLIPCVCSSNSPLNRFQHLTHSLINRWVK